jgi:hypothetical protein
MVGWPLAQSAHEVGCPVDDPALAPGPEGAANDLYGALDGQEARTVQSATSCKELQGLANQMHQPCTIAHGAPARTARSGSPIAICWGICLKLGARELWRATVRSARAMGRRTKKAAVELRRGSPVRLSRNLPWNMWWPCK